MPKTFTDTARALGGPTMGTRWTVLIDEPGADLTRLQTRLQTAVDEVDAQMSTWKPDSDLMRLNAAPLDQWLALPDALMTVLAAGLSISQSTGGAFEMNIGDAVRAWGFGPGTIDLDAIRAASASRRVPATRALELDRANGRACKTAPLALDLSGIAKGYGVDRLAQTTLELGLRHALCSIDGEVRAIGTRQGGRPWAVGIDAPEDGPLQGLHLGTRGQHSLLALEDMAVATSGDYRHFVTVRTTRLSHTMDPARGAPLIAPPASVSVLAPSCMMADAMATALMVMGDKAGVAFANAHGLSALFLQRGADAVSAIGTGQFGQQLAAAKA